MVVLFLLSSLKKNKIALNRMSVEIREDTKFLSSPFLSPLT